MPNTAACSSMKSISYAIIVCLFVTGNVFAQPNIQYEISFKNAVHHEAEISVNYKNIEIDTLSVRIECITLLYSFSFPIKYTRM